LRFDRGAINDYPRTLTAVFVSAGTISLEMSRPHRSEWYANMGHEVLDTTDQQLVAAGGFTSARPHKFWESQPITVDIDVEPGEAKDIGTVTPGAS
jgi:hypothetical protein